MQQYLEYVTSVGLQYFTDFNTATNLMKTHFQLKYTFQSHALRKFILSRLNFKSKNKNIPTVLYIYSKTTEDQITQQKFL